MAARKSSGQRYAERVLLVVGVWLAVFSIGQMAIFAVTGMNGLPHDRMQQSISVTHKKTHFFHFAVCFRLMLNEKTPESTSFSLAKFCPAWFESI